MDIVLDLWIHAIYNDDQVQGSNIGPVVYFRNCTGNPMVSYSDLSLRWGISKSSVSRILNKLQDMEYLSLISFTGRHGSIIYLRSYLSTMFNISDVMIDKEEVSMTFHMSIQIKDEICIPDSNGISDSQVLIEDSVSENALCVSESDIKQIVRKVVEILATQGIPCTSCSLTHYKLYRLSDCGETDIKYSLTINCPTQGPQYLFEISVTL